MRRFFVFLMGFLIVMAGDSIAGDEDSKAQVEIVKNGIVPYKVKGFSKVSLKEELSIDTEKMGEIISTIGSFGVDGEGNIYIFDYKVKKIAKFDRNGKYLFSLGREGEGPGELQSASNIQVNSERIVVTDTTNRKFAIFGKNGNFEREIKIRFTIFNGLILENGNYLVLEPKVIDP